MRATLWVLLLVLAVGVSVLADDGSVAWPTDDGSVAWPVEDAGGYSPLMSGDECVVPVDEPELARLDWQCFKSCWKACYKSCVQECFWWSRLPPVYNACLAACAGACATICGRACWF